MTLISFPEDSSEKLLDDQRHSWIIDLAYEEDWIESEKRLRACCETTRCHLEMAVEYSEEAKIRQHCQFQNRLHHFQVLSDETVTSKAFDGYTWSCSRCSTSLILKLRKPDIPENVLQALYKIRPRSSYSSPASMTQAIVGPSRFSTLMGIEYFLRNTASFEPSDVNLFPREIDYKEGGAFARLVGLEPEVCELMKECLFRLAPGDWDRSSWYDERDVEDEMSVDGIEWAFFPADPRAPGIRDKYKRLRLEMQLLASEARSDHKDPHRERTWMIKQERAEPYIRQLLDSDEKMYTLSKMQPIQDETSSIDASFRKLGCTYEFKDSILIDFYLLQIKHDQHKQSHYLSALELIAKARHSDVLSTEVQKQKSMGAYTRLDVQEAYRLLGDDEDEDDETFVNIAASMMLDDELQKHKARAALEIIGKERDSSVIRKYLNTPDKDFPDVDSALTYLGASADTDDDFLMILFDMKKEDNERLSRSALETLADTRKNVRLRRFLDTGDRDPVPAVKFDLTTSDDVEMLDPDLAYSRLGVDDRNIDDDMLIMLYEIRQSDEPEDAAVLKRALEVIGDTRTSSTIKSYLATGSKEPPPRFEPPPASLERPTGIENIGNTCYLNSLLQYYFTIKPLRDTLLNMDSYVEKEISEQVVERKIVGGRRVTREEIERALRFAAELRQLFREMITSKSSSLKPSKSLCFLALESHKDSEILSASALIKGTGNDLKPSAENQIVLLTNDETSEQVTDSNISPKRKASSISSSSMDNMYGEESAPPSDSLLPDVEPLRQIGVSESLHSSETFIEAEAAKKKNSIDDDFVWTDAPSPVMNSPKDDLIEMPVIPPAAKRRKSSVLWSQSNDWGKQQDVAECIDNCLFQIEAALKPATVSAEEGGEQMDIVKDLFYGITKQTLEVVDNTAKKERFSNTIVTLDKEGQDIYQALDGAFDERYVELGGKQVKLNLTIAQAPPVLQIQIQRAAFDLSTMSAVKSNTYLALDEVLHLDRYMDSDNEALLAKRQQYWVWKRELAQNEETKIELNNKLRATEVAGVQTSDHIWSATANEVQSDEEDNENHIEYIEDMPMPDIRRGSVKLVHEESIQSTQEIEIQLRASEAQEKELSYNLAHAFDEYTEYEYCLHSVFIHRGEASHGHYWIYIYDFQLSKWRKYNDEEVTEVAKSEVYKDRRGMNENPYMLTYIRRDQIDMTAALERDFERTWEEESLI